MSWILGPYSTTFAIKLPILCLIMMLMIYTTFLERTAFPLDLDCLEMARTLVPKLDQGGIVLTVLDWVGGGLHGEPGGSKHVPTGGGQRL